MASTVTSYWSEGERAHVINSRITDTEVMRVLNPSAVLLEARSIVASRLTDLVMVRLAPAVEQALHDIFAAESKP